MQDGHTAFEGEAEALVDLAILSEQQFENLNVALQQNNVDDETTFGVAFLEILDNVLGVRHLLDNFPHQSYISGARSLEHLLSHLSFRYSLLHLPLVLYQLAFLQK